MNKITPEENSFEEENIEQDDMRPEYDFRGGVRGKHYQAYRQGHTVKTHQPDGNVVVQHFTLEDGAVFLEPDVREYFPDAEAVNNALRGLIALIPKDKLVTTDEEVKESKGDLQMFKQFNKTIGDVHDATGIRRDGSGQRKIRNPLIRGDFGVKGEDWIKKGDYDRAPFGLTEEFFERYVEWLKNH